MLLLNALETKRKKYLYKKNLSRSFCSCLYFYLCNDFQQVIDPFKATAIAKGSGRPTRISLDPLVLVL